jgi:transposase InsO family protein
LTGGWVPHDIRDAVVDFTRSWNNKTDIPLNQFVRWLGIHKSKVYKWVERYGKVNEHNASIPRDFWLEEWERDAIIRFCIENPFEGYRRLTFMMLDRDIVAVSPTSTWRVLSKAGLLDRWNKKSSKKGTGFIQPIVPHEHWHVDISYLNICGTFYYLCSLLDGCSRFIVHWEIREQMKEADVEIIIQRAKERFPAARPRIISDNGPQFIARDFKEFIRLSGMTHVKTSPFYPQSNGKLERFHKTIKKECIRPMTPLSLDDARRIVADYIEHYNNVRLHSAIGYIAPADKLNGKDKVIFKERDQKLEAAREQRRIKRQQVHQNINIAGESFNLLTQAA